jgi:hypothetical protein
MKTLTIRFLGSDVTLRSGFNCHNTNIDNGHSVTYYNPPSFYFVLISTVLKIFELFIEVQHAIKSPIPS